MSTRADQIRPAFFLCGLLAFLNLYSTQSVLQPLAKAFDLSGHAATWTISATTLSVAFFAPFIHLFTRNRDPLRVISVAAIIMCLPVLASSLTTSIWSMIVCRFAIGVCIPIIFATSVAQIGELWRDQAAVREVTSLYVAGTVLGGFLGRFMSGLFTDLGGWRFSFAAMAGITLLIAGVISFYFQSFDSSGISRESRDSDGTPDLSPRFDMPLLGTYVIGFLILFGQVATFTYSTLRLSNSPFGLSASSIGAIYGVFLLALVVVPIAGRETHEYRTSSIVIAAALLAVFGTIAASTSSLWLILFGLALSSTAVFVTQAASNAFIANYAGNNKARCVGTYLCAYYLGGSAGAVVPSPLWTYFGWLGCAALIVLSQVLPAAVARGAWKQAERQAVDELSYKGSQRI